MNDRDEDIIVITHVDRTDTAWVEESLRTRVPSRQVRTYRGETLPSPGPGVAGIICLGGPMSAHDEQPYPFLAEEKAYLRQSVHRGIPVLGICLGSQLLAEALGGRATPGWGLEWGHIQIKLTEDGRRDPVLAGFDGEHFSFHSDTWTPPPGATLLATSDRYPQAFRFGCALGVQFHPEISPTGLQQLIDHEGTKLTAAGVDVQRMLADCLDHEAVARAHFDRLMVRWLTQ